MAVKIIDIDEVITMDRRTVLKGVGTAGGLTLVGGIATTTAFGDEHGEEAEHDDEHEEDEHEEEHDDEHDGDDEMDDEDATETAGVRVAHLSPDAPNVDIWVDGDPVLEDVPFGAVSDYLELPVGSYEVTIAAAGDPDTVAFEGDVEVDDADYTIAAIGELGAETFEPLVLVDEREPGDGARVRVVHAVPDAPAVAVDDRDGEATLFDDLAFGEATEYAEVPAGEYTLGVRAAEEGSPLIECFDVALEEGGVYTAIAAGYLDSEGAAADVPFDLIVADDRQE